MKTFKKILEFLKSPKIWWFVTCIILLIISIASTALFITFVDIRSPVHNAGYALYFLSATTFAYTIYCLIKIFSVPNRIKEWAMRFEFTEKILNNYGYRTIIFAIVPFIITVANATINLIRGIIYVSLWFIAFGIYYLSLASMRGVVIVYHRRKRAYDEVKSQVKETKSYLVCGVSLMLLPVVLNVVIWKIVASGMTVGYSGVWLYFTAVYTFYKIIMASTNFAKARKTDQMSVRAIRNVNLADAMVSVLALQTAMFHKYSEGSDWGFANAIMGAIICSLTFLIGIYMVFTAYLKLKSLRECKS
jgi:uncharacterized Tic20 family protein